MDLYYIENSFVCEYCGSHPEDGANEHMIALLNRMTEQLGELDIAIRYKCEWCQEETGGDIEFDTNAVMINANHVSVSELSECAIDCGAYCVEEDFDAGRIVIRMY